MWQYGCGEPPAANGMRSCGERMRQLMDGNTLKNHPFDPQEGEG